MRNTHMQDASSSAERNAESLADRANAGIDRLSETAQQTMARVSETASRLTEKGEELWQMRGQAADTARTYVREHPIATVGIVLALGLLISRLTSRR